MGPVVAAGPVLALPDRDGLLEGVDREPGRLERLTTVGRRHDDRDGRLRERERARAMQERDPLDVGPAAANLGGDLGHALHRDLLVRLVRQSGDAAAPLGVVTHDAEEGDDRAAARCRRPFGGLGDRQGRPVERHPVTIGRRRKRRLVRRRPSRPLDVGAPQGPVDHGASVLARVREAPGPDQEASGRGRGIPARSEPTDRGEERGEVRPRSGKRFVHSFGARRAG